VPVRKSKKKPRNAKRPSNSRRTRANVSRRPLAPARKTPRKDIGDAFAAFVALQAHLRAPGGCPWDREQTHETLRTYLIEEAYEVLDALDRGNSDDIAEELGDLLLQIVFHADIAREAGRFDMSNVIAGIHNKMVRRHPHVFGTVQADTPAQVVKNWEQLKAAEKQSTPSNSHDEKPASLLDGVPQSLPALLEARQLTRRAAKVGFDWHNVEGILEKLAEETAEFRAALVEGKHSHLEEEVGDLLFVVVNIARFLGIDPEVALKGTNRKFKSRFQDMERTAARANTTLSALSKDDLEDLWSAAKSRSQAPATKREPS
jgi:MazG family protein